MIASKCAPHSTKHHSHWQHRKGHTHTTTRTAGKARETASAPDPLTARIASLTAPLLFSFPRLSDEDAQAEYAVKPRRKKGAGDEEEEAKRSEAEDEEEDADDEEAAPASRKKKGGASKRKGKAASAAASAEDASVPGASAPSKKRSAKESAEDAAADASELTNVIYQQLAHSSTTPTVLAQEVIKQYRDPKKSNAAQIALINFMLHVSHRAQQTDRHSEENRERLDRGANAENAAPASPAALRALAVLADPLLSAGPF